MVGRLISIQTCKFKGKSFKLLTSFLPFLCRVCRVILEHDSAAVNDEDNDSQTALHLACIHGKYEVVELLLDKGADIEARDFNLWMPLDCAAAYGRPKCARMLLEAGAPVDPVDKVGRF